MSNEKKLITPKEIWDKHYKTWVYNDPIDVIVISSMVDYADQWNLQQTSDLQKRIKEKDEQLTIWGLAVEKSRDYEKRIKEFEDERKWISVDDRLPENYTSVLVVGGSVRSTALYQDMEFHSDFKLPESKDVTHWMPLPEPPKKD